MSTTFLLIFAYAWIFVMAVLIDRVDARQYRTKGE